MKNMYKTISALCFFSLTSALTQAATPSELAQLNNISINAKDSASENSKEQYPTNTSMLSSAALSIASISALAQYADSSNKKNESLQIPPEIKNLEETKANSATSVFKRYNYQLTGRSADYSSKTNYWWNSSNSSCIATVTYNGRINTINKVSSSDCK